MYKQLYAINPMRGIYIYIYIFEVGSQPAVKG